MNKSLRKPGHGAEAAQGGGQGERAPSFPDIDTLAALRAWYEGFTARAAVHRYLGHVRADGQSSRGILARVRRKLAAIALRRQRPDLAELFEHSANERTARAAAIVRALDVLRATPIPAPQVTDEITRWLPSRIVGALHAKGIRTLAELTVRVPRRRLWWRTIEGLGRTGAKTVESFFKAHPALTEQARKLVTQPMDTQVVPWETLQIPGELDGSQGRYRAPVATCLLDARNDYEAVQAWLEMHEAPETLRAYRKEAERLLLWAIVEKQRPLSSLSTEDAVAYRAFLRHPAPRSIWVGPSRPRHSPEWRPFAKGLSSHSVAYSLTVLRALFRWLVEQRYLLANPFAGVLVRGGAKDGPFDTERSLTQLQWRRARDTAKRLETSNDWSEAAAQRLRFVLDFGYATGLRADELVGARLGDITTDEQGNQWLRVVGKGRKAAKVSLPPLAMRALENYLMQRALSVTPERWVKTVRLVGRISERTDADRASGLSTTRLRGILRRFFEIAARSYKEAEPATADALRHASPHWLRHSHATHALERGVALVSVRDNLRHASIATTSRYLHGDDDRRAREVRGAFSVD